MIYDVCIIGGGPAGMFAAYYSSSRGLKTLLLEADAQLGGRINYYLDYAIYDIPGQFGVLAGHYKDKLIEQLYKSDAEVQLQELVLQTEKIDTVFQIKTNRTSYQAKSIISAVGNGYIIEKPLDIAQMSRIAKQHIQYKLAPLSTLSEQRVAIIGHTPLAIDWAIQCTKKGIETTLFTIAEITLQPMLMDELAKLNVPIVNLDHIKQIDYDDRIFMFDSLQFDYVFASIGTEKRKIEHRQHIKQIKNGLTNLEGYFVAGDCRYEYGKLKLIHGATHDAMQAVNEATLYLQKSTTYQPIVSTHEPVFKLWEKRDKRKN